MLTHLSLQEALRAADASKNVLLKVSQFDLTAEEKLEALELANVLIEKLQTIQIEYDPIDF